MANRPPFPGWPAQQRAPARPAYGEPFGGEFRPGMAVPRMAFPFRQVPPAGAYWNVYPRIPGFGNNVQGWSGYNGGYVASPSLVSQGHGAHGSSGAVGFGSEAQGQGLHGGAVVVVAHSGAPGVNDVRPSSSAVKPLFVSWIEGSVKGSASLGESGEGLRGSGGVVKSSELYRLVDRVEDAIGEILALTDVQSLGSGTECGVCPFDRRHVVPAGALLRHTLECRSSVRGAVEASSLLDCLQYPHTVDLDGAEELLTRDESMTDRHPGAEYSSKNATLSFENAALLSVGRSSSKRPGDLEIVKQGSGSVGSENFPRVKAEVGTTNHLVEELECGGLTLHITRQQFDPRGSLFFNGEAPGVVLTSLAHYASKSCGDVMSSMPHFLRVELEKRPPVALKSISNEEARNGRTVLPSNAVEDTGVENRYVEEDDEKDQEVHGVVEGSVSAKRIRTICSESDRFLTRIPHVDDEREETACVGILPSMLWDLGKELETWKDMPSRCSRIVLQAATCLGRVRKASIVEWLLAHSPAYGVVLDVAMAAHISCLAQLYLKALRTQSMLLFDQSSGRGLSKGDTSVSVDTMVLECPVYAEASTWLASWLSHLYGPINSKAVVLDILKHCLNSCGRFLSAVPLDLRCQQGGFKIRGRIKGASDQESNVSMEHSKMLSNQAGDSSEDMLLGVKQVGAAMDAVYERANFERYIKTWMSVNNASKPQRITSYDMTVMSANNERAKRRNYHAVCEHDGLTWQRSNQEEKRNKTKAELLAEERDYKRRRMSYRGKKLKRTPLQVLHDIIENHMAEITEAGGIGCFSKQPSRPDLESQQQVHGVILSQPNFQHHSGSALASRMSNIEVSGNAPRLYDGHRETSSSVRNESRPSIERRYDDERYHSSRR